jgi:hypothetical protein
VKFLLILVGLVSITNQYIQHRIQHATDQRKIVNEIDRSGGKVWMGPWEYSNVRLFEWEGDPPAAKRIATPYEPPGPWWLRDLFGEDVLVFVGKSGKVGFKGGAYHVEPWTRLDHVEKLEFGGGGDITRADADHLQKVKDLRRVTVGKKRLTDSGLANLARVKNIEDLKLYETYVSDSSLASLKQLPKLKTLCLARNHELSDEALREVGRLTVLESLTVRGMPRDGFLSTLDVAHPITDAGLAHLKGLRNLRELVLEDTAATGAGLAHLKGMPIRRIVITGSAGGEALAPLSALSRLQTLSLVDGTLTDVSIGEQLKSKSIRKLDLHHSRLTDKSIEDLSNMPTLCELDLSRNFITDTGTAHLTKLPSLQVLSLAGSGITDATLERLAALPALRELDIRCTEITAAGVKRLHAFKNLAVLKIGSPRDDITIADLIKELGRMPQLRRVHIRTQADEDYELLATKLPDLEILVWLDPEPGAWWSDDTPMPRPEKKPVEKE